MTTASSISSSISSFISQHCTPTEQERNFVQKQYSILQEILDGTIFQSGSYSRFTANTPLNDLDIIWVLAEEQKKAIEMGRLQVNNLLDDLSQKIRNQYKAKGYNVSVTPQSHSIAIEFLDDKESNFSIDIVPAKELSEKNEFGEPLYMIPEVGRVAKKRRSEFYNNISRSNLGMNWIKTDPKGYKQAAKITNEKSSSFRKSAKLLKSWKNAWKIEKKVQGIYSNLFSSSNGQFDNNLEFKLKSFHIELIVQRLINQFGDVSSLDLSKHILNNIESYINAPQFVDRAQPDDGTMRHIDSYVSELTPNEKKLIKYAAKCGSIILDQINNSLEFTDIEIFLHRFLSCEEDMNALGFSTQNMVRDTAKFMIDGSVRKLTGFPHGFLSQSTALLKGLTKGSKSRKIDFKVLKEPEGNYTVFWKIQNRGQEALKENALRGEITKGSTRCNPETTSYTGNHLVTAYLVDNVKNCVLFYDRVNVKIK